MQEEEQTKMIEDFKKKYNPYGSKILDDAIEGVAKELIVIVESKGSKQ